MIGQALYEQHMLSDEGNDLFIFEINVLFGFKVLIFCLAYRFYMRDLIPNTIVEIWRPHLTIYVDKSPEECLKTIKEKGKVSQNFNF